MGRSVVVEQVERQITIMNKKGEEQLIGSILSEDYQGEVKRYSFSPDVKNEWANETKKEKAYLLGSGSKHLSFINPADAQRILLDQGWMVKEQFATMGGLSMRTIFIHPDKVFADPIDYDRAMWQGRGSMTKMWPAIVLNTNLTIGRIAAEYLAGVFRQICTNGMVASLLQLPAVRFRHTDWDSDSMADVISEELAFELNGLPRGPQIATFNSMRPTLNLLSRYNEQSEEDLASSQFKLISEYFSPISTNVVRPWAMKNYIAHLRAMLTAKKPGEGIYAMDLLNAYTSGVNQYRLEKHSDRGVMVALDASEGVIQTTSAFAALAGLFSEN